MQQASPTTPAPSSHAQMLLGRYRVLTVNNDGGFGTVSICWDTRLQRRVAIKRMPLLVDANSPAQASTLDEALKEARTSSMLAHPNIVTVFDFEVDTRYSYLVMEYVDGMSLADLLARVEDGVLTFDECAHVADCISAALAYAHENGVLHLDIKPANILIDRSGTVKLGDFGMATLASAAGYGGARGGTVGYMPPEQIEGSYVDERTDVFSLAVVVWQSLMGSCPYEADTPEKSLELIRRGPSPTLSRVEPDLAGMVEETLLRALDSDPRARMSSVEAFARDLVRPLGNTSEGADSLRDLLNQSDEVIEDESGSNWGRTHLPLTVRMPWLPAVASRLLAATTAGWIVYQIIPIILPSSANAQLFGAFGVAAASAAWPPLSGAMSMVALVAALVTQPSRASFLLALVIGACGIAWWAAVGRRYHLAGPALLLPAVLESPLASVALAGFALGPGSAFVTGAGGWLFGLTFRRGMDVWFVGDSLATVLAQAAADPLTWLIAAGCGCAAAVCSVLTGRETVASAIAGQIVAVPILALPYFIYAHMENASIAEALDLPALGIAVILGATLCIVTAFAGAGVHRQEDD